VGQLQYERPFLWLVIRAICSRSRARQNALGLEIRKILAQAMLLDCSRSLDLLFGVMVYAAWCHSYVYKTRVVTTLIQLAGSLAGDMGLTKPISPETQGVMGEFNAQGCPKIGRIENQSRTIEERRAVIGLFYIGSWISVYFQRIDPIRWTPYLEECLDVLDREKDAPTDQLLVQSVRVQLLCNAVVLVPWNQGTEAAHDVLLNAFKVQFSQLERSIPPEVQMNGMFLRRNLWCQSSFTNAKSRHFQVTSRSHGHHDS
jgi:hypothetical protein